MESARKLGLARYQARFAWHVHIYIIYLSPVLTVRVLCVERETVMTDIRRIKVKSLAETKLRGKKRNWKTYQ